VPIVARQPRRISVKLLRSTSPEIARCFASGHYLLVRRPVPAFHGLAGNLGILALTFTARAANLAHALILGAGLLAAWNLILLWRGVLGRQSWVLLSSDGRFYIRLFSPLGRGAYKSSESEVIMLDLEEVASVQIQTRKLFVYGPKPKLTEWLVIEPKPAVRSLVADEFQRLAPPAATCDPRREWFSGSKDGIIWIPWQSYRPALRELVRQIELHFPNLTRSELKLPDLDLINASNMAEPERGQLLAKAKRMGHGADCIWALYRNPTGPPLYSRRSLEECIEYMAHIEAD